MMQLSLFSSIIQMYKCKQVPYNNFLTKKIMDEQNNETSGQRPISSSSRQRLSLQGIEPSINKRHNYIEIMDLEGANVIQRDIVEYLLFEERRRSTMRSSSKSVDQYQQAIDEERISDNRISRNSSNKVIKHQCSCIGECSYFLCSCYQTQNENCFLGYCCLNCIKSKIEGIRPASINEGCQCKNSKCIQGYCKCFQNQKFCDPQVCKCQNCENTEQNSVEFKMKKKKINKIELKKQAGRQSYTVCQCTKSHCTKNYCPCFKIGNQCGQDCQCEECQNKFDEEDDLQQKKVQRSRYGRINQEDDQQNDEVSQVLVNRFQDQEMPEDMSFEEPCFKKF